jgi:outer membrane protein
MFTTPKCAMPRFLVPPFNTWATEAVGRSLRRLFAAGSSSKQWLTSSILVAGIISILVGLQAEGAIAQTPATPSQSLTLTGAVDLALKQNLDLQIANIETATRQQDQKIARSDLLPHAALGMDENINRYNLKARVGIQLPGVPHSIGPFQGIHAGTGFSTPLFDMTLIRKYQESGHRLLATRADEQVVREETVLLVVSEYMAHLRALASITAAQSRVELADRLAHQAEDLLTDGVATRIDVSRAQVRVREEQQQLIDAQSDAETTLYALKRILNLPDSQKIEIADQQEFISTPALDLPDPLSMALKQRPELDSLSESTKAAELAHKAAIADSLPKLAFEGRWNEEGETFTDLTPGYEYSVGVKVPIFTGGRVSAERKRTSLAEQQAQKQLDQERNRVIEQVRDSQTELEAAFHQVELGRQQVQLANEEISLSQGRFKSGVADNIEVTAAQDSLARANDAEIGALFRYNIARAQLARAVGSEEKTYNH